MNPALTLLPEQVTGHQTDFVHEQKLSSLEEAHRNFLEASGRLLSVNNWHVYAGPGSSRFSLCNNQGQPVYEMVKEGFYMSIQLPAPGSDAGEGLEWVMIEKLAAGGDADSAEEYLGFTVRPASDPRKDQIETAHFYEDVSTSTFIVRRDGFLLSAGAHGRNETPNNEMVNLHDKIRNSAIALMASVGLSGPQWKKLVEGLIDYKESETN